MKISSYYRKKSAALGKWGEKRAARYLSSQGLTILARNWRCRAGELDIVAFNGSELIFTEVKTIRKQLRFRPADNLSLHQKKRNFNAAKVYILSLDISGIPARFDLIEIIRDNFFSSRIIHHRDYLPPLPPPEKHQPVPPPPAHFSRSVFSRLIAASCPMCRREFFPPPPRILCEDCLKKIRFFNPELRCPGCGGENHSPLDFCPGCLVEPPRPWCSALALFAYQGDGKKLIRMLKFNRRSDLAAPIGMLAADLITENHLSPDLIIPIPLHPVRLFMRSYNQSALIASVISEYSGIPMNTSLRRRLTGRKQSSLDRRARHQGMIHAFYLRHPEQIRAKHILLIDDVLTTGATLSCAADELLKHGAGKVSVCVAARSIINSAKLLKPLKKS